MTSQHAGFVSVIGRPNAGKSSLLNYLLQEKIALVSHKANATRKRSNAIVTHKNTQIVFIDTPGLHEKEQLLNQYMMNEALSAFGDCDVIVYLAPSTDKVELYEKFLELNEKNTPHILVLSKSDMLSNEELLDKISTYQKYQDKFLALLPISIQKQSDREFLLDEISKHLPQHPFYYEEDLLTTEYTKDLYKEFIRESLFENLSDELPYGSDVVVNTVERKENLIKIYANIIVEKDSQKGMVIGKGGQTIKRIGKLARELIENFEQTKIFLKLDVKLEKNWTKNKKALEGIGYVL